MVIFFKRFKACSEGLEIRRKNTISLKKLEVFIKKRNKFTYLVDFSINGPMDQAHGL